MIGDLPESRLTAGEPPFTRTAVDYFGSIEVSVGRGKEKKTWGTLFTFKTTRAVYLDLALSLTTNQLILLFRRFIGIYGKPYRIHSDNGTNFVGAELVLREAVLHLHESVDAKGWRISCSAQPSSGSFSRQKPLTLEEHTRASSAPQNGLYILLWNKRKDAFVILQRTFCAHRFSKLPGS